jgi:hypothetical protein
MDPSVCDRRNYHANYCPRF